jgi:hypothetical protein
MEKGNEEESRALDKPGVTSFGEAFKRTQHRRYPILRRQRRNLTRITMHSLEAQEPWLGASAGGINVRNRCSGAAMMSRTNHTTRGPIRPLSTSPSAAASRAPIDPRWRSRCVPR